MKPAAVDFIFEHAFLPPKLPQLDHEERAADEFLKQISQAAYDFSNSLPFQSHERLIWTALTSSLEKWRTIYDFGNPCCSTIIHSLQTMKSDGKSNLLMHRIPSLTIL